MRDEYECHLRYWRQMMYQLWNVNANGNQRKHSRRKNRQWYGLDEEAYWMKYAVIPNIITTWNTNEMIWNDVCNTCKMNGLECVNYDGGM